MAAVTTIIAAVGLGLSAYSAYSSTATGKEISQKSKEAEGVRKQAAQLENQRQIRETLRKAQGARASALANAAVTGNIDSSIVGGAIGQIAGEAGSNLVAQSQNAGFQNQLFGINAAISGLKGEAATDAAIGDFGRTLFNSSEKIGKIGTTVINGTTE